MHFSFRETIGLTQKIVNVVPRKKSFLKGKLLISDLVTLLPGRQKGGGEIINEYIVGSSDIASLTPSVLGAFYLDFGMWGVMFGMFLLGSISGYFYKKFQVHKDIITIINLAYVYANMLHFYHRGILKPSYFFYFIIINCIFFFNRIYNNNKRGHLQAQ